MISSTGRRKLRDKIGFTQPFLKYFKLSSGKAGFTFIELLLTAIILLVIIGLSVPVFKRTFSDLRVNLQAKDIASLMDLAREKAIMTRITHLIKIDTDKKTYRMLKMDFKKAKPIPLEGKWGRRFYISSSLKVDISDDVIEFSPDGSSGGGSISLEDVSGFKRQIQVDAGTGEITVGEVREE